MKRSLLASALIALPAFMCSPPALRRPSDGASHLGPSPFAMPTPSAAASARPARCATRQSVIWPPDLGSSRPSGNLVGSALIDMVGAALREAPSRTPHARIAGSPAVVVEEARAGAERLCRVVTADGSVGWTLCRSEGAPARVVFPGSKVDLRERIATTDVSGEEPSYRTAHASTGIVLGASDKAHPEQITDLGGGNFLGSTWLPWFRVRAGAEEGWLAPSDTRVAWVGDESSGCSAYESLHGLVRGAFLGEAWSELLGKAPAAGETVFYLLDQSEAAWPEKAECSRPEAAFFPAQGRDPVVVASACEHPELGKIQVLTLLSGAPSKAHYVVDHEQRMHVIRVELANVGHDAAAEMEARRAMFDHPDALLVALDFPVSAWGIAAAFPTQAAACKALQTRNPPKAIWSRAPNQACRRSR